MNEYVAVLDLGTSKMLALAVSMENRSNIIASAQVESGNAMKRGIIADETEFKTKINELLENFQAKLPAPLTKIYIGLGGQGLHSETRTSTMPNEGEVIEQPTLSAMEEDFSQQSLEWPVDLLDMYAAIPEYYLDGELEDEPIGKTAQRIEGHYFCIVGHQQEMKEILDNTLRAAGIDVVDYFISPLATAASALSIQEKQAGCALVEMGATLSYLSIYSDGKLCYLQTLPLGGDAITGDLCTLDKNLTTADAEKKKITEGKAFALENDSEAIKWIEARMLEILSNLKALIQQSGYADQLEAGIVLTGGASQLRQIDQLWATLSKLKMRLISDRPEQSCALGMAKLGKELCGQVKQSAPVEKEPEKEPEIEPVATDETEQKNGIGANFAKWITKKDKSAGKNKNKEDKKDKNSGMKDLFSGFAEKILND